MAVTVSNYKVEPVNIKWGTTDLGAINGDVTVAIAHDEQDVVAHQYGTNVLDSIITGIKVENLTVVMNEVDYTKLKTIVSVLGDTFTPALGTEVFGYGTGPTFTSKLESCLALNLHPQVLISTDYSRDITFWKAYPTLKEILKSGENVSTHTVEFKFYPDLAKDKTSQYCVFGDATQAGF